MQYHKIIILKDGRPCVLRNGTEQDGQALLDIFILTHTQTDFLIDYPDEITMTAEQEMRFLKDKAESEKEIEILAETGGSVVGSAGIWCIRDKAKIRHRAGFGIGVNEASQRHCIFIGSYQEALRAFALLLHIVDSREVCHLLDGFGQRQ